MFGRTLIFVNGSGANGRTVLAHNWRAIKKNGFPVKQSVEPFPKIPYIYPPEVIWLVLANLKRESGGSPEQSPLL